MSRPIPFLRPTVFFPRVFFFLFLVSNALLSYFPLSLEAKLWVGTLGVAFPLCAALFLPRSGSAPSGSFLQQEEFLPPIPAWAWLLLGAAAVFLRFDGLTTFSAWPHYDEGMLAHYVLRLCRHWRWNLFTGSNQTPPLYLWGLALTFKALGPSLFSLWLFPAVLSLLTVPLGYLAAREFFPRSTAFLAVALLALGFWPVFIGRFSHMTVLVVAGECLALLLLGRFLNRPPQGRRGPLLLLGLGVGLGFYIYISWPVVAAMVGLAAAVHLFGKNRVRQAAAGFLAYFILPCLLVAAPLAWEALHRGYGGDFRNLSAFASPHPGQWKVSLSYVTSLFWGMDLRFHTYQPVWGGYLNPLLGSLFLLGALELLRHRRERTAQWLALAFLVFLLPGVLTRERETFRVVPLIPVVLALVVVGWRRLLDGLSPRRAAAWTALFLLASAGLDGVHLVKYHRLWDSVDNWRGFAKSLERYRAYGILKGVADREGPGLVFPNFTPGLCDRTLDVADYAWNAVENPALSPGQARWAAVLANVNEKPFLDRRFGPSRAFALSRGDAPPDGGWMLWVTRLTPSNRPLFRQWIRADRALEPYVEEDLGHLYGQPYSGVLKALAPALPEFRTDPFLAGCFWEKMADLSLRDGDPARAVLCLRRALQAGFPSAHLYYRLGMLYSMAGDGAQARRAFRDAVKAPLNLTDAARHLRPAPSSLQ